MAASKILIVEDDEDLQTLYGLYLQGESFEVFRAFNGKEGLEMVEKEHPNVIILDMIMPVMDGEEFLTRLRTEKKDMTKVIIASVNDKIPQKLFDFGNLCAVLRKPFGIDVLVTRIKDALKAV